MFNPGDFLRVTSQPDAVNVNKDDIVIFIKEDNNPEPGVIVEKDGVKNWLYLSRVILDIKHKETIQFNKEFDAFIA